MKAITIKCQLKELEIKELDIVIQPSFTYSKSTKETAQHCENCFRLTITYEFLVNFEQVSHIVLIFLFLTLNK